MAGRKLTLQDKIDRDYPELAQLSELLDSKWSIVGIRFGIDAIAGLLPVVGDAASGVIQAYIVFKAYQLGAPRALLLRMAGNVGVDVVVGSIPVAGSVFDLVFKANNINIRLLREHLVTQGEDLPPALLG